MNVLATSLLSIVVGLSVAIVNAQNTTAPRTDNGPSHFLQSIINGLESVTLIPQAGWTLKKMTLEEIKYELTSNILPPVVEFFLYHQLNQLDPERIFINDSRTLAESHFNSSLPTRFIIHGWTKDYLSEVNVLIRNALLETGAYNVISVDWSDKSKNLYTSSVSNVPLVGEKVAQMIDFLNTSGGLSFNNLVVIGHSLGAHVAGFSGKYVTAGKIRAIIGLDAARVLFNYHDCQTRLCYTDAHYVEAIHTSGKILGFVKLIGHADFYANGGLDQPGCDLDLIGRCSHTRAYMFYAESIRLKDFKSIKCKYYWMAVKDKCGSTYDSDVRLGSPSNEKLARGSYYTPVRSLPPYGV